MFRIMFCVLIALLLPACDQGGPQEANQTPAAPSPEAPEASATNDTEERDQPRRGSRQTTPRGAIHLNITKLILNTF